MWAESCGKAAFYYWYIVISTVTHNILPLCVFFNHPLLPLSRFLPSLSEWERLSSWLSVWRRWHEFPHVRIVLCWPHLNDRSSKSHCTWRSDEMSYCWYQGVSTFFTHAASLDWFWCRILKEATFAFGGLLSFFISCLITFFVSWNLRLSWWLGTIQLQHGQ